MAFVTPQSNFRLIANVPWNSSYKDTRYFSTTAQQLAFFASRTKYTYNDFTYIRQSGAVSVPVNAENIFECNYCAFQNAAYGSKWFYAFITGIEYVNDNTSVVTFTMDLIQTWLFDFSLGTCYIEREHVGDDTIGKHTVDENLPTGEYISESIGQYLVQSPIIVLNVLETASNGQIVNGVYSPTKAYTAPDAATLNALLVAYDTTPEKIASLIMAYPDDTRDYTLSTPYTFTGYTPKNNKLYVYPYNFMTVGDFGSNNQVYHFEDFDSPASITFNIKCGNGANTGSPYAMVIPRSYKGINLNSDFALCKTDFPSCAYSIDNFRAWQAFQGQQAKNNLQTNIQNTAIANESAYINSLASGATGAVGGIMSGNVFAAATGVANLALSQYNTQQQFEQSLNNIQNASANYQLDVKYHAVHGVSMGGTLGSATALWQQGSRGFLFKQHRVRNEYAKIIDDFFTRFGYKVLECKVPDVTTRANFNYLKTIECEVHGNIPNYANVGIQSIFNAGITLWHNDNVGDYSANPIA